MRFDARPLAAGRARGTPLVLSEPISFWGGVDPATGTIIDVHHPQVRSAMNGRILVLPAGRGSSSSSSVVAEVIRRGVGPAGILLSMPDPIIALGCLVAAELYGRTTPVVALDPDAYRACAAAIEISVEADTDRAVVNCQVPSA